MLQLPFVMVLLSAVLAVLCVVWWILGKPEDYWSLIRPYDFTTDNMK